MSKNITIKNAIKRYGDNTIIPDLSLEIKNGELFTLLGPSGCGKTTLLRMIAGFNSIEGGIIEFSGAVINNVPPHRRNIGMVFQDYAIFPHLTVEQNVRYGLKEHKVEKKEAEERLDTMLRLTKIDEYRKRLPENLSGGQQQRVALARAIAIHPDVLLMDEPLSNLDAKLRIEMRGVIREIQHAIEITTVYVTHDQEEALAISDRIAVMNFGEIQQVANPHSIYTRPFNVFVADFIGHSGFLLADLASKGSEKLLTFANGYNVAIATLREDVKDQQVVVGIRPEEVQINLKGEGIPATIVERTYLGKYVIYFVELEDVNQPGDPKLFEISQDVGIAEMLYEVGQNIHFTIYSHKINVFNIKTTESLIAGVTQYAN